MLVYFRCAFSFCWPIRHVRIVTRFLNWLHHTPNTKFSTPSTWPSTLYAAIFSTLFQLKSILFSSFFRHGNLLEQQRRQRWRQQQQQYWLKLFAPPSADNGNMRRKTIIVTWKGVGRIVEKNHWTVKSHESVLNERQLFTVVLCVNENQFTTLPSDKKKTILLFDWNVLFFNSSTNYMLQFRRAERFCAVDIYVLSCSIRVSSIESLYRTKRNSFG